MVKDLKAIIALLATLILLVGVNPAWAAYTDCNSSNICMWANIDFTGTRQFIGNSPGERNLPSTGFNDVASSWANRSFFYDSEWWYDINQSGWSSCMDSGTRLNAMSVFDDNEASSTKIYTSNEVC